MKTQPADLTLLHLVLHFDIRVRTNLKIRLSGLLALAVALAKAFLSAP